MTRIALSITLLAALAGCATEDPETDAPKTSVATAAAGDLTVELLTDTRLETGKTPIYLKVTTATGQLVTDAAVTFKPMMAMAATATTPAVSHSAPVVGTPIVGADGLYRCDAVFQMPSSEMGSWSAIVGVQRPGMPEPAVATFDPITIADSGCAKVWIHTDPATSVQTRYVMSMDFVAAPKVGLNPVVVTLHTREDMMTFPPVEGATFTLDPQMPSMGHGSPGSVNPTPTGVPGVYEGQLSFSMTGPWETTVTVRRGDVVVGTQKFSVTF